MNPYANAAHVASLPQEGNPRETEAWALTEAARRLAAASRGSADDMRDALRLNWKLWTIFQAEITARVEAGDVSEALVNMLSLCQFVDFQTVAALTDPGEGKLEALVNINRSIAGGLRDSLAREARETADLAKDAAPVAAAPSDVPQGRSVGAPLSSAPQAPAPGTVHTPISAIA